MSRRAAAPAGSATAQADAVWYADGLAFACAGCGGCCGGAPGDVWVSDEEIDALAAALGMDRARFVAECVEDRPGGQALRERANWDCVLLDPDTRRCRAYAARPLQCRLWPWWRRNVRSRAAWRACARDCPGVGRGDVVPADVIRARVEEETARYGDW